MTCIDILLKVSSQGQVLRKEICRLFFAVVALLEKLAAEEAAFYARFSLDAHPSSFNMQRSA